MYEEYRCIQDRWQSSGRPTEVATKSLCPSNTFVSHLQPCGAVHPRQALMPKRQGAQRAKCRVCLRTVLDGDCPARMGPKCRPICIAELSHSLFVSSQESPRPIDHHHLKSGPSYCRKLNCGDCQQLPRFPRCIMRSVEIGKKVSHKLPPPMKPVAADGASDEWVCT